MDTDSFTVHIKTDDIYKDIAEDVEARFHTSKFELDRPLPKGKMKKHIRSMAIKLIGKVLKEFVTLRANTYIYLIDNGSEDKKAKGTKKCVIKRKLKFENYINLLEATQLENKRNHLENNEIHLHNLKKDYKEFIKNNTLILRTRKRFKNEWHNVFTEETNEITLSSNDDKRMQSTDSIERYAYETSKDLKSEKEKIKCNNIIKRYKND